MNRESLLKVFEGLRKIDCTWAIGGSLMLSYFGLGVEPRDVDILIDAKDAKKIRGIMENIGKEISVPSKGNYRSKEFFRYNVDDIEFEFIGDFKIQWSNSELYQFILDEKAIISGFIYGDIEVNLTTLEDWYVAYGVMMDPKERLPLIEEYFKRNGIQHRELLERSLRQRLPDNIINLIKELIEDRDVI